MIEKGCVDIWLDEIVPCLKDLETGLIEETFVFKIESRSILKKYNSHNGWEIDWINIPSNIEIFALALKRNNEVQGLRRKLFIYIGLVLRQEIIFMHTENKNIVVLEVIFLLLLWISLLNWDMMVLFMALPLTGIF